MKLSGRWYYFTGTLIVIEVLIPFFLSFEGRKPQARHLVTIAVMCALAVASRVVVPIPNFKPIFAIIMLTGVAFGPEAGFLVGAVSAFASTFFYGQGPYMPWQMLSYGMAGFLTGFASGKHWLPRKPVILGVFWLFYSAADRRAYPGYQFRVSDPPGNDRRRRTGDLPFRHPRQPEPGSLYLPDHPAVCQPPAGKAGSRSGRVRIDGG